MSARKSERALSASSLKVYRLPSSLPSPSPTQPPVLGTNLLNSQTVAIKFVGPSPHHQWQPHFTIHRNPERLKHRSSETNAVPTVSWPVAVSPLPSFSPFLRSRPLRSRNPPDIPFRSRGIAQHPCHRSTRPQLGGSIRYVRAEIHCQDGMHGGTTNGAC